MGRKKIVRSLIFILAMLFSQASWGQECVVLLHGYLRSNKCMSFLEEKLGDAGYKVQNLSYPSTKYSISTLSREHVGPRIEHADCDKIHFVGHSMGGIVLRHYLSENKLENLGHVVLITAPNGGSELVNSIQNNEALSWVLMGPAVHEIAVNSEFLKSLPLPYYNVGIITASKSLNPITSLFILDGGDDGTLTIESMKLQNMTDIINLSATHTMVISHPEISTQVESFLKKGRFIK